MKTKEINDSHIHISMDTSLKETIQGFKWYMEESNCKRINFLALNAHVFFEETQLNNSKCLFLKSIFSPNGYAGYCIDYSKTITKFTIKDQIVQAYYAGFDCWKIIEAKPDSQKVWGHAIDEEIYDDAFAFAEEHKFPIILHTSDPIGSWDEKYKTGYLKKEEYQQQVVNVLEKHPNLIITIAHMGFMSDRPQYVEELLNSFPNLHYDIVPGPEEYFVISENHTEWKRIFEKYSDRFVFGTDRGNHSTAGYTKEEWLKTFPETASYEKRIFIKDGICDGRHPFPGIEELWGTEWYGLNISDDAFNNIFYNNFLRLYGEPKTIDYSKLLEYANYEFSLKSKSKSLKEDYELIVEECKKHI